MPPTFLVLIALIMDSNLMSDAAKTRQPFTTNDHDNMTGITASRNAGRHRKINKRQAPVLDPRALLDYHNKIRRSEGAANMIELRWDDNLAKNAKKWIEKCNFEHPVHYVPYILSQNLYFAHGTARSGNYVDGAIGWFHEKKDYDFSTGHCRGVCSHYTTMVKWDFIFMGCAVHDCPSLYAFGKYFSDALYLSCEYYSPVKDWPKQPYVVGQPCSKCPENFRICNDNLCSGPDSSYPPWNASEVPQKASMENPSAFAIIFNLFLVLVLI